MAEHSAGYVLAYAAGVCLTASVALTTLAVGLRARQEQMAELDRKFNVLKALHAPVEPAPGRRAPASTIEEIYARNVRPAWWDPATSMVGTSSPHATAMPLYQWIESGRVTRVAIPVSGKGLWSTIYGFMALDPTGSEILGITFYRHGETPGLGGEIEQPWFQRQFEGRRLRGPDGRRLPIVIAKGRASKAEREDPNRVVVDGISGATLTGRGVMEFLNRVLDLYEPCFRAMRKE
jgi:Na+-transporting NADH:ubiquinone oxidoreductase subunit C